MGILGASCSCLGHWQMLLAVELQVYEFQPAMPQTAEVSVCWKFRKMLVSTQFGSNPALKKKKKSKDFPRPLTFWLALLTTCTHSASCRDPTLERGQRHTVIYRIPSPRSKTETNTDLAQNKQLKSSFILLKLNLKLTHY